MKFKEKRFKVVRVTPLIGFNFNGQWYVLDMSAGILGSDYVHSDGIVRRGTRNEQGEYSGWFKSRYAARKTKALAEAEYGVY